MSYVVYTDLDGTLLDHYDYSFSAALPALNRLQALSIPVIPVSSKTRAEIEPLRQKLNLAFPFVIENGAAVFIPDNDHFSIIDKTSLVKNDQYWVKEFSPDNQYWSTIVNALTVKLPNSFRAFSQMGVSEIVDLTGLTQQEAAKAAKREYSDPIYWFGNETEFRKLVAMCGTWGIDVVRGGRFVHLLKGADKGLAISWLHNTVYCQSESPIQSVALGDGENDLSMLAAADMAIQIKSPTHAFPKISHDQLTQTVGLGPIGWNEAILNLLKNL